MVHENLNEAASTMTTTTMDCFIVCLLLSLDKSKQSCLPKVKEEADQHGRNHGMFAHGPKTEPSSLAVGKSAVNAPSANNVNITVTVSSSQSSLLRNDSHLETTPTKKNVTAQNAIA